MNGPVLRFSEVSRTYCSGDIEVHALVGVSFQVAAGELVAVMGPSGSGKSTLLALAGGLDLPTSGSIRVEDVELTACGSTELARLRRDRIGYVFQDFNLISELTAAENVALPRELAGVRAGVARREALTALAEVGMSGLVDRFPYQMSGGQQQRVAIARAFIGERRVVLADEPTGALDSRTGEAVLEVLRRRVDAGAAGILVTHEPRYAGWADRTIFLHDGHVVHATASPVALEQLLGSDS